MTPDEEQEFGDYVVARSRRLCEFAYLLCGDWHAAEDAVQTALAKLFVAWRRLRERESMDAYVRRIVVRVIIDQRRLLRSQRESSWAEPPDVTPIGDAAEAMPERLAVLAALAKVPPRQRAVLVLRFFEEQSIEETAEALRCSTGTVKSQTARGLRTLRALLATELTV